MYIDSHCHLDCLDLNDFSNDLNQVIKNAHAHKVTHMLCVCLCLRHFPRVYEIAQQYPNVYASVGLHPNEQEEEPSVERLLELACQPKVVALGETGLDYYRSNGDLTWQRDRFRTHIQAAIRTQKPLIIHTREAAEDTLRIMKEEHAERVGGVMHCFTGTWEMAEEAIALGFYISFAGIVTFKNATALKEVAKKVPLDRLLIETDSPYLAPEPFRGKQNQPAYVGYVAEHIAMLRKESLDVIANETSANFNRLFMSLEK